MSSFIPNSTPISNPPTEKAKEVVWKRDLIKEIAETHELSLAKSERILNTVLDTIVEVSETGLGKTPALLRK